jgi:hypothetical protein
MYMISKHTGDEAREKAASHWPGFDAETVTKTEHLEVWGTSFSDPGPDYCQFRAFDKNHKQVGVKNVDGY